MAVTELTAASTAADRATKESCMADNVVLLNAGVSAIAVSGGYRCSTDLTLIPLDAFLEGKPLRSRTVMYGPISYAE